MVCLARSADLMPFLGQAVKWKDGDCSASISDERATNDAVVLFQRCGELVARFKSPFESIFVE